MTLLTQNPKPATDADYFELIKELKKVNKVNTVNQKIKSYFFQIIAKDSNIPVVLVAAKCLTSLAKGLRKAFKTHAVGVRILYFVIQINESIVVIQVLEVCLDRFREKKTNVIEALRETCEAAYPAVCFFLVAKDFY